MGQRMINAWSETLLEKGFIQTRRRKKTLPDSREWIL
jgi:hypothetical protein